MLEIAHLIATHKNEKEQLIQDIKYKSVLDSMRYKMCDNYVGNQLKCLTFGLI